MRVIPETGQQPARFTSRHVRKAESIIMKMKMKTKKKTINLEKCSDMDFLTQVQYEMLRDIEDSTVIETERYNVDTSLYVLCQDVASWMSAAGDELACIQGHENNAMFVHGDRVWAYVTKSSGTRPLQKSRCSHSVTVWGLVPLVAYVFDQLDKKFKHKKANVVQWAYTGRHGLQYKTIVVDDARPICPEFYPFIEDVDTYFERFMGSESQVLLMTGPPGTGKTSLIRWALDKYRFGATITYETKLVRDDELFVHFLTSSETDFLVFEDVDLLLAPRQGDNNDVMSKFLNLSDGIVKFPRKKIVFSTNLSDPGKVDSALTRPGRCFDAPEFRELTYREACAAAEAVGLPEPDRACTLAELFNGTRTVLAPRRAGFLSELLDEGRSAKLTPKVRARG